MKTEFLKPRLVGERFNDHSIPVEVFKDWAAFEGLIIETAKWLYLEENHARKRTPRGFADSFSLSLSKIEEGSAIAVLDRTHNAGNLVPDGFATWFDQALERVLDVIGGAESGGYAEKLLPKNLLAYFDQFGRSLHDDEQIEFLSSKTKKTIVYNKQVRKTLVLKSANFYKSEESIRGSMSELNLEAKTFTLRLINNNKVVGHFNDELKTAALAALEAYGESLVKIDGATVRDQSDTLRSIEQVTRIEALDPLDVPARLEALSQLREGWMDGVGLTPPAQGIHWLARAWSDHWPEDLPLPFAYPTPEGYIQLEWSMSSESASIEIDTKNKTALLVISKNLSGDLLREESLDLSVSKYWENLSSTLRPFLVPN